MSDSNCAGGAALCIQPCTGQDATVWNYTKTAGGNGSVTVTTKGSRAGGAAGCLQTASQALDASVFVGACSTPPTPQQLWTLASDPPYTPGSEGTVYAGVCVRADINGNGACLSVNATGHWVLAQHGQVLSDGHVPAARNAQHGKEVWTTLQLTASGSTITPVINGVPQPPRIGTGTGMVAVVSGYHIAYFDDFQLTAQQA